VESRNKCNGVFFVVVNLFGNFRTSSSLVSKTSIEFNPLFYVLGKYSYMLGSGNK
jgi:hypothetical protein